MKEIFYGAAIQGAEDRAKRAHINRRILDVIIEEGFRPFSEHTAGSTREEGAILLQQAIGQVPYGVSRSEFIRRTMLQGINGSIVAAIFELSIPSIGTGIEFHHVCTRVPRGFLPVPILALYQKSFWPSGLSTMVRGISQGEIPNFQLAEYEGISDLEMNLRNFLLPLKENMVESNL